MAEKFDPRHADRLENPERLVELPPANVLKLLALTGGETLVDFGAGTGMYTLPVAQALPLGRVVAVDEHAELLAYLRDKLAAADVPAERVTLVATSENEVPLPDGGADRILLINVLHHVLGRAGRAERAAPPARPGRPARRRRVRPDGPARSVRRTTTCSRSSSCST